MTKLMKAQHGFTLIEIMVVVVIAAILMGAVTMSFPRTGDDLLKEDAGRFTALISLVQDEAILQSRDMALAVHENGYQFYSRESGNWTPYSEGPFVARSLRGGIKSNLYIEGVSTKLKKSAKTNPQIVILSSGEMTPFTYFLGDPDQSNVTISVNAVGTVKQEFKREEE